MDADTTRGELRERDPGMVCNGNATFSRDCLKALGRHGGEVIDDPEGQDNKMRISIPGPKRVHSKRRRMYLFHNALLHQYYVHGAYQRQPGLCGLVG